MFNSLRMIIQKESNLYCNKSIYQYWNYWYQWWKYQLFIITWL